MVRERERKYEVPAAFALPDGLAPAGTAWGEAARHELTATYWDTADLRLARDRVALRRRLGGSDPGWHVKRYLGPDERDEVRLPAGRSGTTVPARVAAEVRAVTRGERLRPVVLLTTSRTEWPLTDGDGRVLALVADDHVTARSMSDEVPAREWREVEVELVDGDRSVLRAVERDLRRAGATPAGAASKVARALDGRLPAPVPAAGPAGSAAAVVGEYLRAARDALVGNDPLVRRDVPDTVHRMRVATRRLRSTLHTFRPLVDRAAADALRVELRWLAEELGRVRDAEVLAGRLARAVAAEPPELVIGPVEARLTDQLRADGRRHRRALLTVLDSPRYATLLDSLDALLATAPTRRGARAADVELPRLVGGAVRRVDVLMTAAARAERRGADRNAALHEARKAAKRARYAAEAAVPVGGAAAGRLVTALAGVQELLGDHHDSVVTRELLRGAGQRAYAAGENAFSYGLLHARQATVAARLDAELPVVWKRAGARKVRGWLR